MKFYKLEDLALRNDDQVFKTSPIGKAIAFLIFSALVIGCLAVAILGGIQYDRVHVPSTLLYFIGIFLGIFVWFSYLSLSASLRPTNWVLRCDGTGVIIKYRSYLNWHFPVGNFQAVGFDYAEIAWARTVKEKRFAPDPAQNGSAQSAYLTYLDLCLSTKTDLTALEASLRAERSFSPEGFLISRDYPVSLSSDGILEIRWNGLSPSVRNAIDYLKQHVQIVDPESRTVDLVHQPKASPEAERGKILELIKSGDEIAAIKLARDSYGYSLSEATDYVKKLATEF